MSGGSQKRSLPIHLAASAGHVTAVTALLAAGASANATSTDGATPLHQAANRDVVHSLFDAGADVDARCRHGKTPLLWASSYGRTEAVEGLLAVGADVNFDGYNRRQTALHLATAAGHFRTMVALIDGGASVNARRDSGRTPLHVAVTGHYLDMVVYLVEQGVATVDARAGSITPLMMAAARGHADIAAVLVAGRADVNARDDQGTPVLHMAAASRSVALVASLIRAGADPSQRNAARETAAAQASRIVKRTIS